jgi:thiosulfate/3-mercaptopyruvate sulfurtransferase
MSDSRLSRLLEPKALEKALGTNGPVVIDLSLAKTHAQGHIAGARLLDYSKIVRAEKPVMGLLPSAEQFSAALCSVGVTANDHIVAYDDEGGGKAARLLWTLECFGHSNYSLLNGGLHAWANEGHPLTTEASDITPSDYQLTPVSNCQATVTGDFIREHLNDDNIALLDARSPQEFSGEKRYAERGGRIPGAVNIEWTEFMDQGHNLRLKPEDELRALLEGRGFTTDKTVVAYCQTHHRSAHTWFVLDYLGYKARGYEGSWSDWGNQVDTPIEV